MKRIAVLQYMVFFIVGVIICEAAIYAASIGEDPLFAAIPALGAFGAFMSILYLKQPDALGQTITSKIITFMFASVPRVAFAFVLVLVVAISAAFPTARAYDRAQAKLLVEIRDGDKNVSNATIRLKDAPPQDEGRAAITDDQGHAAFPCRKGYWMIEISLQKQDVTTTASLDAFTIDKIPPQIQKIDIAKIPDERWTSTKLGQQAQITVLARSGVQRESGQSPDTQYIFNSLCPFGAPKGGREQSLEVVIHEAYISAYNTLTKCPAWVAEKITPDQFARHLEAARPPYRADPLMESALQADSQDFRGSGFDRGNLAAGANHMSSLKERAQCYYFTNIAAQTPKLNRGIWAKMESTVRQWAQEYDGVYVITGTGILPNRMEEKSAVAVTQIGANSVTVPTHWFKVIYRHAGDRWISTAFICENRNAETTLEDSRITVEELERWTGVAFFPDMRAEQGQVMADELGMWPLSKGG